MFYNYGCHRIIHEIDIENKPEPRAVRGAPLASEGRYFVELIQFNCSLQCAREFLPAGVYGEAENRPPLAAGKGVMLMIKNKLPHTGGAGAKARSAEPCAPTT